MSEIERRFEPQVDGREVAHPIARLGTAIGWAGPNSLRERDALTSLVARNATRPARFLNRVVWFRRLLRIAVRKGVLSVPSAAAMMQFSIDEVAELVSTEVTASGPREEDGVELAEYHDSRLLDPA